MQIQLSRITQNHIFSSTRKSFQISSENWWLFQAPLWITLSNLYFGLSYSEWILATVRMLILEYCQFCVYCVCFCVVRLLCVVLYNFYSMKNDIVLQWPLCPCLLQQWFSYHICALHSLEVFQLLSDLQPCSTFNELMCPCNMLCFPRILLNLLQQHHQLPPSILFHG